MAAGQRGEDGNGGRRGGEPRRQVGRRRRAHGRADRLFDGERVRDIGPPGLAAPEGAEAVDAEGTPTHPGLINGDRTADGGPGPDLAHHVATLTSVNADQRRSKAPAA
jgi:hypothetical protein